MRRTNREHGRVRKYVTREEVERLLSVIVDNEMALRDRGLILVCYHRGFRVSELIDLTWQDVDLDKGLLLCRRLKRGRDTVQRLLPVEIEVLSQLVGLDPEYVFPSSRGGKMSRCNVNRIMKEAGRKAGVPVCNPHALRHGCGFELAMRGVDTRRLQRHLGLRSLEIAATYTDLAEGAIENVWG